MERLSREESPERADPRRRGSRSAGISRGAAQPGIEIGGEAMIVFSESVVDDPARTWLTVLDYNPA